MPRSLPDKASMHYLHEQAKDLLKAHRARDQRVCATLRLLHRFREATDEQILAADVALHEVQFALALEHGCRGWNELRHEVELREQAARNVRDWERFGPREGWEPTEQGRLRRALADPEWRRLLEIELSLEPMSPECRQIRRQIACLERCHESYLPNVRGILGMIGSTQPGRVLDCGQISPERRREALARAHALDAWLHDEPASPREQPASEVRALLGARTAEKAQRVEHLLAKLRNNAHKVYPDVQEDFETVESRIQHLEICNFNWLANLRIVLREIAAGQREAPWHTPDGFNACGDCPLDRSDLEPALQAIDAWVAGHADGASEWTDMLGRPDPEKRWLAACLAQTIRTQHGHVSASQEPAEA